VTAVVGFFGDVEAATLSPQMQVPSGGEAAAIDSAINPTIAPLGRLPPVQLLVFTAIGLVGLVAGYAFLGGTLAFLIFLAVLFVGICARAIEPIMERLRP
jgi:hypothetical protein